MTLEAFFRAQTDRLQYDFDLEAHPDPLTQGMIKVTIRPREGSDQLVRRIVVGDELIRIPDD